MRVLFLTCHLPAPPISGGRRREFELLTRLDARFTVDLVAVSKTPEEDVASARSSTAFRDAAIFPAAKRRARLHEAPQVALHESAPAGAYIQAALAQGRYDVLHVEGFYLWQHVPRKRPVPTILGTQNVESTLWSQRARHAGGRLAQQRMRAAARATRQAERAAWGAADLCLATTAEDAAEIAKVVSDARVALVEDGADHATCLNGAAAPPPARDRAAPLIVLPGNFAYAPTEDGALFFCDQVLPRIVDGVPDVRVALVGNAPGEAVSRLACGRVTVTGRVSAMEWYLDSATLVVCPLRVGGGVKVKVLEAIARGKAVVTSSVGIHGLPQPARGAVRVADDAHGLASAVVRLLRVCEERAALERLARTAARTMPRWSESARALARCYEAVVASRSEERVCAG